MKQIKSILILILFASPLIFLDLYSKQWAHKNITDSSKEIKVTETIILVKPLINYWFAFNSNLNVSEYKRWFRNAVFFLLAFFCLYGQWQGSHWFDKIPWIFIRAGNVGNAFDACFLGGVTDFIYIKYHINNTYFVANLADLFIFGGILSLIIVWIIVILCDYMFSIIK